MLSCGGLTAADTDSPPDKQQRCLPEVWYDQDLRCQGVDWCDYDVKECGPTLTCADYDTPKTTLNSSLVPEHHYCREYDRVNEINLNEGEFNRLDRSDETSAVSSEGTSYDIDINNFPACNDRYRDPGVRCGPDPVSDECVRSYNWCRGDAWGSSDTCGPEKISPQDRRLCNHPAVWANTSCTYYNNGRVRWYGKRCTGTNQQCITPWYTVDDGNYRSEPCEDKSDQIFTRGLTCREHLENYKEDHDARFCSLSVTSSVNYNIITIFHQFITGLNPSVPSVKSELICQNKTQWLSEQDPSYSDPHRCQESCSNSSQGLDCAACTNSTFPTFPLHLLQHLPPSRSEV